MTRRSQARRARDKLHKLTETETHTLNERTMIELRSIYATEDDAWIIEHVATMPVKDRIELAHIIQRRTA